MEFEFISSKADFTAFNEARSGIVKLYNASSALHEEAEYLDPAIADSFDAFVLRIKGETGGIAMEKLIGNERVAIITFAAIEEKYRGNSIIKKMIAKAGTIIHKEHNAMLCAVQLNDGDDIGMWFHLGFVDKYPLENGTFALVAPAGLQASYSL
ncbi:hypothetical protein [Photobacterium leiognathi]|uniref:hypothetical protein n=1 Tax=Photobacterium leiognathi TaxID=553611 RepID=UPI002980ED72|nr:hypothetical protein [Photobacterium leiognathi]